MNDTKNNPNENEKFLRMKLSTLQKRYKKLAKEYATRLSPSTDGIETLIPEPGKSVLPSTSEYSRKRGDYRCDLMHALVAHGIVTRFRNNVYIADPEKHGHLVVYKTVTALQGARNCLYWTLDGIKFLDEFVETHRIRVLRPFTF